MADVTEALKRAREILGKATEGPWDYVPTAKATNHVGPSMRGPDSYEDAEFIAFSRNTYEKLLDVVEAASGQDLDNSNCPERDLAFEKLNKALEAFGEVVK